jgi:hypothetical protein
MPDRNSASRAEPAQIQTHRTLMHAIRAQAGSDGTGLRRSLSGRVLRIIGGEHPLGSAEPPRLSHELGHLIEVGPVEPDQDRRAAVVMGRDEKRARLGLEQLVALLQAGAAYEERIGQLVRLREEMYSCWRQVITASPYRVAVSNLLPQVLHPSAICRTHPLLPRTGPSTKSTS